MQRDERPMQKQPLVENQRQQQYRALTGRQKKRTKGTNSCIQVWCDTIPVLPPSYYIAAITNALRGVSSPSIIKRVF